MDKDKAHIFSRLQQSILLLQGFKPASSGIHNRTLGLIRHAFPNNVFPTGAFHEFVCNNTQEISSSSGFITGILSSMWGQGKACLWVHTHPIFPPALSCFGIEPDQIIFVHLQNEKEICWTIEEALKCNSLSCVVGELNEISFTESRRFQLAAEQSGVTGFILRHRPKNLRTSCVTRWNIRPLPGEQQEGLPGLGFPRWHVDLIKVRNGKTGCWRMEWNRRFRFVSEQAEAMMQPLRKIS